ncbi:MAG: DUF262 domain-containing protein [Clostridiales bacterium]|nr:DUF262 domain-containing protein [Clostridiales bacterium]
MAELFTTNPEKLLDLISDVYKGSIQLPDFQRGWVWDEERIQKLLVSIIKYFPIGAVMMLNAGGHNANFCSVTVKNVPVVDSKPKRLLLDGQQRLTSLYQALYFRGAVDTTDLKKKDVKRFYYFDILEMIKDDIDEDNVVIIANEKKCSKKTGTVEAYDYSTIEKECENDVFPANLSLDVTDMNQWGQVYTKQLTDPIKSQRWNLFFAKMLAIRSYNIPVISLTEENKKEAVCSVFENVNTGGVPLNVFELLTATFASDGFRLRHDWEDEIEPSLKNNMQDYNKVLQNVSNVDFLQSLTLLATSKRSGQAVACKRKHILDLTLSEYKENSKLIRDGYIEAARFLLLQNIYSYSDLPYGSQLVPMAAFFAALGLKATTAKSMEKIAQWYWNGVFGEMYGGANETRFVKDFIEVISWIQDSSSDLPDTIKVATFRSDRLDEMRTKNSAAYKGVGALLLQNGACDFIKGYTIDNITKFNSANIDIHHIFPQAYCIKVGISAERYNSIVNKAPIAFSTNRSIGGHAPSVYIPKYMDSENGYEKTNELLESQLVNPELIRQDNFEDYYAERKEKLVALIEKVMGKKAVGPEQD